MLLMRIYSDHISKQTWTEKTNKKIHTQRRSTILKKSYKHPLPCVLVVDNIHEPSVSSSGSAGNFHCDSRDSSDAEFAKMTKESLFILNAGFWGILLKCPYLLLWHFLSKKIIWKVSPFINSTHYRPVLSRPVIWWKVSICVSIPSKIAAR